MASATSGNLKGPKEPSNSKSSKNNVPIKRRTGLPVYTRGSIVNNLENRNSKDGCDSGLSSDSSTPTNGSPPPRQSGTMKSQVSGISGVSGISNIASMTLAAARAKNNCGRLGNDRMSSRLLRNRSGTESPRSLDNIRNRQISSPLKMTGNSPCLDSGDESSLRMERGTYQHMFQDIVSIKTMLLKLKRVLQESGENDLTRAETLNPFDNSIKNGLFCNLNEGGDTVDVSTSPRNSSSSIADELTDLRRQVIFLQGQVEDRDRTIQVLQIQISKLQRPVHNDAQSCSLPVRNNNISSVNMCNAATQTEKMRPVSAGPSLLQSLPQDGGVMGPLVSWSDSWDRQQRSLFSELNSAGKLRKPTELSPHTIRLRQEYNTLHRGNVRKHSLERLSTSFKPKDCTKLSDSNNPEYHNSKVEEIKSLIPTPTKLRL